jgi:hypothetical protein
MQILKHRRKGRRGLGFAISTTALLLSACGGSESNSLTTVPSNPKEAATQVEQVFQDASPPVREAATQASEAMRRGDYEQAVVSLQIARNQETVTLQQGMAIHNSMVAMEASLIRAMQAGDPKAKQAYEILRRMKRDR